MSAECCVLSADYIFSRRQSVIFDSQQGSLAYLLIHLSSLAHVSQKKKHLFIICLEDNTFPLKIR